MVQNHHFMITPRNGPAKVNRGGLFEVSNEAYCLFVAIENTINGKLHEHLYGSITTLNDEVDGGTKQTIVQTICEDDVLFQ